MQVAENKRETSFEELWLDDENIVENLEDEEKVKTFEKAAHDHKDDYRFKAKVFVNGKLEMHPAKIIEWVDNSVYKIDFLDGDIGYSKRQHIKVIQFGDDGLWC